MEPGEYAICLHTWPDVDGVNDYVNDGVNSDGGVAAAKGSIAAEAASAAAYV